MWKLLNHSGTAPFKMAARHFIWWIPKYLRCLKENPSAFKIRFTPDIWVFCSWLIISRIERAVARNSFGEMAAGSHVPGIPSRIRTAEIGT